MCKPRNWGCAVKSLITRLSSRRLQRVTYDTNQPEAMSTSPGLTIQTSRRTSIFFLGLIFLKSVQPRCDWACLCQLACIAAESLHPDSFISDSELKAKRRARRRLLQ